MFHKKSNHDGQPEGGLKARQKKANRQDKRVREGLTEDQIDKGLKDSMAASDPVAKY